ncbi:MAG: DUF932 domain-containing protein [Rhodospirillales bacterium]
MPHNLFQDSMAFVGEVPWHGLGVQVPPSVTAAEMIRKANLDWKVSKVPARGARIMGADAQVYDRYLVIRDGARNERSSVDLAIVGAAYEPLQNSEAFAFFEPFIDNKWGQFHTAGALGNGERIWVLVKMNGQIRVDRDDAVDKFLLLSNSHDGTSAVTVRFTPIRVVCQNTLNYAMRRSSGVVSVRHTKHVAKNLAKAQAKKLKEVVDKVFADAEDLFGNMVARTLKASDTDRFLELLLPKTKNQKNENQQPARWMRIKAILDDSSVTPPQTRNTLWALYNAIVRDEDYRATREAQADARLERVWFGRGRDLKVKALKAARRHLAKAA